MKKPPLHDGSGGSFSKFPTLLLRSRSRGSRSCARCRSATGTDLRLLVAGVAVERAGRSELAELVADHALRHEDGNELAAVVDGEGEADGVRGDRAAARPRLDDLLRLGCLSCSDLLGEMSVDESALFD